MDEWKIEIRYREDEWCRGWFVWCPTGGLTWDGDPYWSEEGAFATEALAREFVAEQFGDEEEVVVSG